MSLRLRNQWFNPVYFHIRHYEKIPTIRKIMIYGGKSSAKTLSLCQFFSVKAYNNGFSSIAFRKEQTTIKTTIKQAFIKSLDLLYLKAAFKEMDFKFKGDVADLILKGLDEEGKVKGVEGYKYLLFDELDHFLQAEWTQANASLRGMEGQKLFATWNPVDDKIWIKKKEIDTYQWSELPRIINKDKFSELHENSSVKISNDGKILLIKTTYWDNKWVVGGDGFGFRDQNLIDEYERMQSLDENWYRVNVLGEWGIADRQKKFAWAFNEKKHISDEVHFNENEVIWLSWDFNVNPISCTAFQYYDDTLFGLQSFKLEHSDTWTLCDRISATYPNAIFMVTGDASGDSLNSAYQDQMHNYRIIQQKLGLTSQQLNVPVKNPSHKTNQFLVNAVLLNFKVQLHKTLCQPLIHDLLYVEVNEKKEIIKDPARKNEIQLSDFLDHFRYLCNVLFDIRQFGNYSEAA